MGIVENIISGIVGGVSATAIVWLFALLYRRRMVDKYRLSQRAKKVLAALWDEGLIRLPYAIATELDMSAEEVLDDLETLKDNGLARIRKQNENGQDLWKITWKARNTFPSYHG